MATTVAELVVVIRGDVTDFEARMNGLTGIAGKLQGAFAAAGFVALAAGVTDVVKAAVEFETAFTGVAKTIDGTDAQLAVVRQSIRDMAKELPVSAIEIAKVAEAAGQLGVKIQDISSFTEVMIKFGASTNVSADEAATAFAQIATVMNTSLADVNKYAAVVVALGNSFATTEAEILEFANRLSGTAATVGVTQESVLALSAAAASVGINAEAGGTAFSTAFAQIFSAISTGGDQLKVFASTAGLTVTEFSRLFKENAVEALIRFSEGVNKTAQDGGNFQAVLDAVGLGGIRTTDAILKMGSANDLFRQSQALANTEMQNANALNEEFAKRQETAAANMTILQNHINDLKITFGDKFLPVLIQFTEAMVPVVSKMGDIVLALDKFDAALKASQASSQSWVQGVIDGFVNFGKSATENFLDVAAKINNSWSNIDSTAVSSWENIKQSLVAKWIDIKETAGGWFDALRDSIDIKWGEIFANVATAWGNIKNKLIEKWTDIKATASGWFGALVETVSVKWGEIFSGVATAWNNIKAKLVEKWNDIKASASAWVSAVANAIVDGFQSLPARLAAVWENIKNTIADKAAAIKKFLGISSPSKVFIDIGMQVGKGFEMGVSRSLRGIEVPFQEVIPAARGALMGSGEQTGTSINRSANMNLVQNFQTMANPEEIRRQAELALRRFALEFPIR